MTRLAWRSAPCHLFLLSPALFLMAALPPPGPFSRFAVFLLVGGVALVLAMLGLLKHLEKARVDLPTPAGAGAVARSTPPRPGAPSPAASAPPAPVKPLVDPAVARLVQTISEALAVLRDPNNPNKKAALASLREALAHSEPKVAIAAIRQFLAGGENADTGLRFKVGEGGVLDEAPTMRTFLMDQLGTISRDAGTNDAAEEARATLQASNSPDESAVAMRNLAWADPEGSKTQLAASERAMLDNAAWRQSPTGGYLEAFDVAAYSGDASLFDELAGMAKTPGALQRAALVAMERLSALSPGQVVSYLNAHPDLLADRPLLRADYMGNVDLSDPAQLAQIETYLQRTDVTDAEKDKFIGRLVIPAGFSSNNLLTPSEIPVSVPEHRALVNQVAGQWLASGKFPTLQTALQNAVADTGSNTSGNP